MARRKTICKYDRGFCVPIDFQEGETVEQWSIRNPSTRIKREQPCAPWQDFNKPTPLNIPNIYQGRKLDLSRNQPTESLPDRTLRFKRSYEK